MALSLSRFLTAFQRFRRHLLCVERFGGIMLVSVGRPLVLRQTRRVAFYLSRFNHLTW
jgi:hypothetical protein